MHSKRYQVFISSTFEDLQEERRAVQDVVISTGDFPVQMESFPAADENQFEFIKTLISQCDYYVLIIAGRYGAIDEEGISYTHKEFRYAVSKEIPVLVMLHGARDKIALGKSEETEIGKSKLVEFVAEAEFNRLRKTWTSIGDLKLAVREALDNAKATKSRAGWVRGDSLANVDALSEINKLRKQIADYEETLGEWRAEIALPLPALPKPDKKIFIDLLPNTAGWDTGSNARLRASWLSIFPIFQNSLVWNSHDEGYYINEELTSIRLGSNLAGIVSPIDPKQGFKVVEIFLKRIISFYIEAGWMNTDDYEQPFTDISKKLARRYNVVGSTLSDIELISGNITVNGQAPNIDDEVPF
ncbi:MAG: hypothetical protein CMO05_05310 [Thalassospira sp.]|uniref:DUF4062 domain-containing protein n=1 Tax=Thalassospira sp. GB04J01 TaxID=1485225 RepID=UPI000C0EBCA7|nr:DUF4062 domain-containing protein [Thalassospira sp. GB04J01]MBV16878.1 hypothetical protein [Thalassospira sp.]